MDPIITRPSVPIDPDARPAHVGSFLLSWTAGLAGVAVLIASGYMFYGFAENDTGAAVLLSAFILCFGAGALAYGPLFIIAKLIGRARLYPRRSRALWVLALALPWLAAGAVLLTFSNNMRYVGGAAAGLSLLFILWALRHFRQNTSLSRPK
jgi:hypothetical protein